MPYFDNATRAQALSMKVLGFPNAEIEAITGIQPATMYALLKKAKERGFDPEISKKILDEHVCDSKKSGRPTVQTEDVIAEVVAKVRTDRFGREKTCAQIALEVGTISAMTAWRILKAAGFSKTKPTRKPGLDAKAKAARLRFCLRYRHWTLEDWKKVIWTDETAVVCGFRRGGYRVWRTSEERYNKSCIRPRWKGYTEFQFWGSFTWDRKGPCHIWNKETKAQRKLNDLKLKVINDELEPICRAEWELTEPMRRLGLRNKPGKRPEWKWTMRQGRLTRSSNGGIDWFRYCLELVVPKLIPFAKETEALRPGMIIQEDGAPAHKSAYKSKLFSLYGVSELLWPGNSPDLNMIEPAWSHLKRVTTAKGAPQTRAEAEKAWLKAWNDLDQHVIQAWIERIPRHIEQIIELKGGNEYREGKMEKARRFQSLQTGTEEEKEQRIQALEQQLGQESLDSISFCDESDWTDFSDLEND
jgi:transposase